MRIKKRGIPKFLFFVFKQPLKVYSDMVVEVDNFPFE